MACLAVSARLSWRHEVLLCAEKNTALQGEDFFLYYLPPPLPTPNFMKCKPGPWGLTKAETDSCCLYSEQTHSCSKARLFSNEIFSPPGNESSSPGMMTSQKHRALRKPLEFIVCFCLHAGLYVLNQGPLVEGTLGSRGQSHFQFPIFTFFMNP